MSTTQTSTAYRTAPAIGYSLIKDGDTRTPTNTVIHHGLQPNGRYLNKADLDSHGNGQDADAARMALARQLPEIHAKIDWYRSQSGTGWHGYYYTNGPMPHGKLHDQDGRHVGELLASDTAVSIPPESLAPGWLSATERDLLLRFWSVDAPADSGERWSGRAAEAQRYIASGRRQRVTRAQLRSFLQGCGATGMHLNALFDERGRFDRSAAAGNLMQCLMFNAHKLAPSGGYSDRCAAAYDYWLAADSYGKAADKDYNQAKDGAALIGQILHDDRRLNGGQWRAPFWAKAHPTPASAAVAPEPTQAPKKPAHRPTGDRDKMRRKIRRYLELRAFETVGKLYYSASDLADVFGIARRTMQAYLAEIPELTRGQDGGRGGRAWLVWGADNSQKAAEPAAESAAFWGADAIAVQSLQTPQTDDRSPQCKEDHQDLSAPLPPAAAALLADDVTLMCGADAPAGAHNPGDLLYEPERAPDPDQLWYEAWIETDEARRLLDRCQPRFTPDPAIYARMRAIQCAGGVEEPPAEARWTESVLTCVSMPDSIMPPSVTVDLVYVCRLLDIGEYDAIQRHCRLCGADYDVVLAQVKQKQEEGNHDVTSTSTKRSESHSTVGSHRPSTPGAR